jgi:hypothetical protein
VNSTRRIAVVAGVFLQPAPSTGPAGAWGQLVDQARVAVLHDFLKF